jgi:predicted alpha/beta-hydrolase family hydrolase
VCDVATTAGTARLRLSGPAAPSGLAVLGPGAGGGVDSADLLALTVELTALGFLVARVEQPYRVAGRRAPAAAAVLDAAFQEAVGDLTSRFAGLPLVTGGRSLGARVACRTAGAVGARAVACLAFPLHPPGRPERSRLAELIGAAAPVIVVQGERDPFGAPGEFPDGMNLVAVPGADHALRSATGDAFASVARFLRDRAPAGTRRESTAGFRR